MSSAAREIPRRGAAETAVRRAGGSGVLPAAGSRVPGATSLAPGRHRPRPGLPV